MPRAYYNMASGWAAFADPSEIARMMFLMKGHLDDAVEAKVNEILATLDLLNSPLADVLRKKWQCGTERCRPYKHL